MATRKNEPVWVSQNGTRTRPSEMAMPHLINCIKWIERQIEAVGRHNVKMYKDNLSYEVWLTILNKELNSRKIKTGRGQHDPINYVPTTHEKLRTVETDSMYNKYTDTYTVIQTRIYGRP